MAVHLKSSYFSSNTVQIKVCDSLALLSTCFCEPSEHSNTAVAVLEQAQGLVPNSVQKQMAERI